MVPGDARNVASPALFDPLWIARGRCNPSAAARPGNSEDRLLRENENGIGQPRLRTPRAETRSRSAMLRRLRLRSRRRSRKRDTVRLSGSRRRKFCRLRFVRANPLATSSCSAAARLIRFESRRLVSHARDEVKGNSTGGFHEISLCDHSGPGADRHSERDFELG